MSAATAPSTPRASWSDWLSTGLKDVALTDEQLKARDLARTDPELTKRFGKGTVYNLKLVVKGDLGTGKSSLLKRLRGGGFSPTYEPSPQIATAKIAWKCGAAPEDVISIDVWEVIDRASKKTASTAPPAAELTLEHRVKKSTAAAVEPRPSVGKHELVPLDATVVDVYAGAHAVIFMIDPSKPWTLEYVVRELATCPPHLPVAVLLSFRDYGPDRRMIHLDRVEATLCAKDGPFGQRTFKPQCFEASMANCFGLHTLNSFLTVPFLAHKRAELQRAIEINMAAMGEAHNALTAARNATYEEFVASLEAAARAEAMRIEMARAEAEAKAAAAAKAEADKWAWLTGDAPPGPPRPGAPGAVIVASSQPAPGGGNNGFPVGAGVLPGGGIFARVHPGQQVGVAPGMMASSAPQATQPGAPSGGVSDGVMSYLGIGSYLGGLASGLSGLVGAAVPGAATQSQGAGQPVKLDDFLGPEASAGYGGEQFTQSRVDASQAPPQAGGAAAGLQSSTQRRGGSSRRHDVRGWDSDEDSDGDSGTPTLAIPSMRPENAPARQYVLEQQQQGPSSSDNTPTSSRRSGGAGGSAFGAGQHQSAPVRPVVADIPVGGAKRAGNGKPLDWDASSDED